MNTSRPLSVAALAALVLTACGGGDNSADATVPVSPPVPPSAPTPPAPPTAPTATTAAGATPTTPATTAAATVVATTEVASTSAPTTSPAGTAPTPQGGTALRVTLPGVVAPTNPMVVDLLDDLASATGNAATADELIAGFGMAETDHLVIDGAALFEISGTFDASFADDPEIRLEQSYVVQSDSPDPAALLTAIAEAIEASGDYTAETGSQTNDDMTLHYIDLSGTNFDDGLPRWSLLAGHLGENDPEWQGIVEIQVEMSDTDLGGATLTVPPALAELDAKATSESPLALSPYQYEFDNGLNMYGGFPVKTASVSYLVDAPDFATAAPAFDAALTPAYGAGDIDAEDESAFWGSDPYTWFLRLNFEDKVAAEIDMQEL